MLASYEHENMQRNAQEIVAFLPLTIWRRQKRNRTYGISNNDSCYR